MKHTILLPLVAIVSVLCLLSCSQKPKVDEELREEIIQEFMELKSQLPMKIEGTNYTMLDLELDGDLFAFTVSVPMDTWSNDALSQGDANSDKNIARVIYNYDDEQLQMLIDANLGFKYTYVAAHDNRTLMTVTIPPQKIDEVKQQLKDGTLVPYTIAEVVDLQVAQMAFPQEMGDEVWLTDMYTRDGDVYCEALLEYEVDPSYITDDVLASIKQDLIAALAQDPTLQVNKRQLQKENTRFIYIYKDNRGVQVAKVTVTGLEILGSDPTD